MSDRDERENALKEIRKHRAPPDYRFSIVEMISLIFFMIGLMMLGCAVINLFLARYDLPRIFIILGVMFICLSVLLMKVE